MSDLTQELFDRFLHDSGSRKRIEKEPLVGKDREDIVAFLPILDAFLTRLLKSTPSSFDELRTCTSDFLGSLGDTKEKGRIEEIISHTINKWNNEIASVVCPFLNGVDWSFVNYFLLVRNLYATGLAVPCKFASDFQS
mgnify:CR=1 FL=1|tara:strand:+ start:408 stop:821 length:414 start_codon:yes stop_codon:yes gene_type:complete